MVMPRSCSMSMRSRKRSRISRSGNDAAQLQDTVGHRGFAVVDVRDDAEVPDQRLIGVTRA